MSTPIPKVVPASLVTIVSITLPTAGLGLDSLRTMSGDAEASPAGGLPAFSIPSAPLNLETLKIITPYAVVLAAVGLMESLLTLTLVDELTETRGRGHRPRRRGLRRRDRVRPRVRLEAREGRPRRLRDGRARREGLLLPRPLLFGSNKSFAELFDLKNDSGAVIIELQHARVSDHSAIEAIDNLAERYLALGKTLQLRHLSPESRKLPAEGRRPGGGQRRARACRLVSARP